MECRKLPGSAEHHQHDHDQHDIDDRVDEHNGATFDHADHRADRDLPGRRGLCAIHRGHRAPGSHAIGSHAHGVGLHRTQHRHLAHADRRLRADHGGLHAHPALSEDANELRF